MKIPRDPDDDFSDRAIALRRDWLAARLGRRYPFLYGEAATPNAALAGVVENPVGTVGIPVGLAGPLLINGDRARGSFVVPLATTEGALVASFSRGMRAITEAGGCRVLCPANAWTGEGAADVYRFRGDALTKVSAIILRSEADAAPFDAWLRSYSGEIAAAANATSRHARLLELTPLYQGDVVGLAFRYATGNAMGLNMATKGNEAACAFIREHSGGLAVDYFNTLGGDKRFVPDESKGRYVSASAVLPADLVRTMFRSTPVRMRRFLDACNAVLAQRGATAPNIHVANALAALFIACDQDPAFVTVSFRNACTAFDVDAEGALHASVTLPNLIVGTLGGGTKLPAQRECLEILGCSDDARKLAEIVAAVTLAGEVSVAGAVSAGEFTRAHTVLGRGLRDAEAAAAGGSR